MDLTKLKELEQTLNGSMGISCVKQIILYVERGKLDEAKGIITTDHDKLRNYPEIMEELINLGLARKRPFLNSLIFEGNH